MCADAGVSRDTFYRWLKDDGFRQAWESAWHGTVLRHLPGVVSAMVERAQSGDVAAARLIADMAGVIKQRVEQSGDITIRFVDADD